MFNPTDPSESYLHLFLTTIYKLFSTMTSVGVSDMIEHRLSPHLNVDHKNFTLLHLFVNGCNRSYYWTAPFTVFSNRLWVTSILNVTNLLVPVANWLTGMDKKHPN